MIETRVETRVERKVDCLFDRVRLSDSGHCRLMMYDSIEQGAEKLDLLRDCYRTGKRTHGRRAKIA